MTHCNHADHTGFVRRGLFFVLVLLLSSLFFFGESVHSMDHCPDLSSGDVFQVEGSNGVYALTEDMEYMSFPSAKIYASWFKHEDGSTDWSSVNTISASCASAYEQRRSGPSYVGYIPGSLIKDTQNFSGKVYAVGSDHEITHVPDAATAKQWFGDNWESKIQGVTNSQSLDYTLVDNGFPVEGMFGVDNGNYLMWGDNYWFGIERPGAQIESVAVPFGGNYSEMAGLKDTIFGEDVYNGFLQIPEADITKCTGLKDALGGMCSSGAVKSFDRKLSNCTPSEGASIVGFFEALSGLYREYIIHGIDNGACLVDYTVGVLEGSKADTGFNGLQMNCRHIKYKEGVNAISTERCSGDYLDILDGLFGDSSSTEDGSQTEPDPQAEPTPEPEQVSISIASFAFSPGTQTISVGDTVTWTNTDRAGHSVIADSGAFSSSILSTGESFSFTFDTSGTYTYFCGPHPSMKGTVVVE